MFKSNKYFNKFIRTTDKWQTMSIASGDRKSLSDSRTLIQELRSSKRVQEETEAYLLEKNVSLNGWMEKWKCDTNLYIY
jgi:hypothetical protein